MSVAVITGGAGGIARACAHRLADRGPILLADLDADRLANVREGVEGEVHVAVCDVSDPASVAALATRASELGPLGALVHTAGLAPPGAHDPRRVLEVNLGGTRRVLDAFVHLALPGAVAVCIASLAGHRAFAAEYDIDAPDLFDRIEDADVLRTYSVSKHGVMVEVRRRAAAWGAKGARIVSVSPGLVVDTSIGQAAATIHAGAYADQSALKRPGYAADIAGAVAFLTSDDASYITGTDLLVDGGVVAHTLHHAGDADRERWNRAGY
jgi:NAD(P)-dependent dehydrogenase (short-subunit alcohol dehydrogenase family)